MAVIDTILDTPLLYISSFCPHMFSRGTARCQPAFIALPNMLGARTEVATTRSWRKNDPPVSSWLGNLKNFRVYKWECHGTIFSGFCSKPCLIGRVYL